MFENLSNLTKLMRGAGQIMPRIEELKRKLESVQVEGVSGDQSVTVRMSGSGQVLAIQIHPSALSPENQTQLQSSIAQATNAAVAKSKALHLEAIRTVLGDLGIPGLDNIIASLS